MIFKAPEKKPYKAPKYKDKYDYKFALFPTFLDDGRTVWLERYLYKYKNKGYSYKNEYGGISYRSYKKESRKMPNQVNSNELP